MSEQAQSTRIILFISLHFTLVWHCTCRYAYTGTALGRKQTTMKVSKGGSNANIGGIASGTTPCLIVFLFRYLTRLDIITSSRGVVQYKNPQWTDGHDGNGHTKWAVLFLFIVVVCVDRGCPSHFSSFAIFYGFASSSCCVDPYHNDTITHIISSVS